MIPGNKNVAGETLWLALMPLQPLAKRTRAQQMAPIATFQFNFTNAQYKSEYDLRNA